METVTKVWEKVVMVGIGIGGFIAGIFGGWDASMWVLIGIMAVDYASGMIVASMGKSAKSEGGGLNSNIGWKGIGKKVLTLLVVLVGALVDRAIGGGGSAFRTMACWFYIANEALSFLENTALAGMPYPDGLKKVLEQMRDKGNEKPPDGAGE